VVTNSHLHHKSRSAELRRSRARVQRRRTYKSQRRCARPLTHCLEFPGLRFSTRQQGRKGKKGLSSPAQTEYLQRVRLRRRHCLPRGTPRPGGSEGEMTRASEGFMREERRTTERGLGWWFFKEKPRVVEKQSSHPMEEIRGLALSSAHGQVVGIARAYGLQ